MRTDELHHTDNNGVTINNCLLVKSSEKPNVSCYPCYGAGLPLLRSYSILMLRCVSVTRLPMLRGYFCYGVTHVTE